ncbi:alpha/beta fold hydrolase [Microbacterium rhizomatis]|uniref:Alpha/beta hydrolase n=1 Tax=Microbacterium rhizomatis TaxID=1631477 RepID=A0A5J5J937_9MICO|nr:alpha/beta hydrolase [Microbacterium rhizomatis]KAA9111535.1 alpha/beta hydrolase [Microbacterium rhizomatis]
MDIVLVPGLWLNGATWNDVAAELTKAGHTPHPVTLPGMESSDADRTAVTLADCVGAVTDAIDAADGPVVLAGHSAGAGVASVALDRRVDRVARIILVGGFPALAGEPLMAGFSAEGGDLRLPPWSDFDEADLRDLDEDALSRFSDRAVPSPAALALDPVALHDERRYGVPLTAVCTEFSAADLQEWIAGGEASVQDFTRFRDLTYVDLPTGHWPQFTKPRELAGAILAQPPLTGTAPAPPAS